MKIGLVTPYVYPLPGGVNDHVGHLYESLRARGHDVRILTASHGLQRSSEGDVIRIGKGFSVPANGSVGTLTISPRYRSQIRDVLDRERFDLLHFHEPFVPFLTLMTLRESRSVNVATFHAFAGYAPGYQLGGRMLGPVAASRLHGRIAVSAAARHFADRYLPGDYKVIPNGVDLRLFAHAVPLARWQDGPPNILFVGRLEPRKGLLHLLKAFRMVRKAGCDCRLLVVGSGPLEREARRYVMTRRLGGRGVPGARLGPGEGPALQDGRRLRLAGDRSRELRDRPARGDGGRDGHRLQRHPRLQGRREARRAGAACAAGRPPAAGRGDPPPRRRHGAPGTHAGERPGPRPGVRVGPDRGPRRRPTTASSSAASPRRGRSRPTSRPTCPRTRGCRADPQAAPVAASLPSSSALRSASASRQTDAE